jgi:dihydroorotase
MRVIVIGLLGAALLGAQTYDLLIKGGHVIDPANGTDGPMDVAIAGGKIARVAPSIPAGQARKIVDAGGLYVTPGLIDLHAHVFGYSGSLFPDDTSLVTGATTIVDAGGPGWRTIDEFRDRIVRKSRTRVLAFLNIVGHGMVARWEQNVEDMDPAATAEAVRRNRDILVGIKTAHYGGPGYTAIQRAVEAGRLSGTPVMVDSGILSTSGRNTREKLLDYLRPGDMHTHAYNDRQLELVNRFSGQVQPYIWEARKRGVLFDLGHGGGSFMWPVAVRAMQQGFPPDTISTDLHASSIMGPQSDMPNCISKLVNLGMPLADAIRRSTVAPARAIARFPELGTLNAGAAADVAVLSLEMGVFAFKDAWGKKRLGTRRLQCVMTVRDGKIVYDRDGLGFPLWTTAGDYEVLP